MRNIILIISLLVSLSAQGQHFDSKTKHYYLEVVDTIYGSNRLYAYADTPSSFYFNYELRFDDVLIKKRKTTILPVAFNRWELYWLIYNEAKALKMGVLDDN